MARVAIVGAAGYVGGRLARRLLRRGLLVRAVGRHREALQPLADQGAETAVADVADFDATRAALMGVDYAYYLVHSMGGEGNFAERDRRAARNFWRAAADAGVQRIIYLGGLGDPKDGLSKHLASREEVARIFAASPIPATILRAGVIVGRGSASFQMIQDLIEHLPVLVCPRWIRTACQPIAIDDALTYLAGCLDEPRTAGGRFDIGGPDVLSYEAMLRGYARVARLHRLIVPVPVLTPRLSSYWIGLVTGVRVSVARPLIEGVRTPAVCRDHHIRELLHHSCQTYEQAVRLILRGEGNA